MFNIIKQIYRIVEQKIPIIARLKILVRNTLNEKNCIYNINGTNNSILKDGVKLNNVKFNITGNNNKIIIGPGCYLNNVRFYIKGSGHNIDISENCWFKRRASIDFEDENCTLFIGKNSVLEEANIAVVEPGMKVIIGEDCMFGQHIYIRTTDSHSIISQESGKRINFAKNIEIEDHVWICDHCIILKGVHIGKNSIIGAGSVVTKSCGPGVILAGNPAKVVKTGVSWDRERINNQK
ncbi:MAG: DapH/DapD/GlmU-related protein [bacterium]